jgi:hypothetical protein
MVPVTAKSIVSPSSASTSACRNEPTPLSLVLVTVIVSAYAESTAHNNAAVVATVTAANLKTLQATRLPLQLAPTTADLISDFIQFVFSARIQRSPTTDHAF